MPMHQVMPERRASPTALPASAQLRFRHSLDALPSIETLDRETLDMAFLHRHSAPMLHHRASSSSASSSNSRDTPESVLMRASVQFVDVVERDGHCAYAIKVSTMVMDAHVIHKRYSEIRDFRGALLSTLRGSKQSHRQHQHHHHCAGPCNQLAHIAQLKFPSRRMRLPGRKAGLEIAQDRAPVLERFLQSMLRVYRMTSRRHMRICLNANCRTVAMIKAFLQVTEPIAVTVADASLAESDDGSVADEWLPRMPLSFSSMVTRTSLRSDKPVVLFSIAEDPEPQTACI